MTTQTRYRIGVLAYYPMGFQSAFFRALSLVPTIDLTVYYLSGRQAWKGHVNRDFRAAIRTPRELLAGYRYDCLSNFSPFESMEHTLHFLNPGLPLRFLTQKWDALIISGWSYLPQILLSLLPTTIRTPYFLRTDTNGLVFHHDDGNSLVRGIRHRVIHNAAAILTTSTVNRIYYESAGIAPNRLFSSPFAVDNEAVTRQFERWHPERAQTREELGIRNESPILIYAGKLIPLKRPDLLLRGAAPLLQSGQLNLVFVGEGESRAALESSVRSSNLPNVYFRGFIPNEQVPRYLAASDIFALLSPTDAFGLAINEAMLCHNALLVSATCGAARDLVREGVNGRLIHGNDPTEVTLAIRDMLTGPIALNALKQSSASIIANWGPKEAAAGVVEALRAVL